MERIERKREDKSREKDRSGRHVKKKEGKVSKYKYIVILKSLSLK